MDCQILYEGTDITNSVVTYERDQALCTGVGVLRVELKRNAPVTPVLYKTVTLYEDGIKKGTYFIHTIDKGNPSNTLVLNAQDASIKLQEYFIAETYYIDYPSASDYWIRKFLDDATISYVFNDGVGAGSLLSNNTSLGIGTTADMVTPLLQQNGWYLVFDADNVAHIGKTDVDTGSYSATLTDNEILSINTSNHDRMFRNRILVWGNGNPVTHRQVIAEIDRHGSYGNEYPGGNDVRSVVIANSNIKEGADAYSIANRALKEFEKTNFEIALDVAGTWDLNLGDYIFVSSEFLYRGGVITTIGSSMSDKGLITHIILNQRCPRLFAFFDWGGYIYAGTDRAGVWRKPLKYNHTWTDYSAGITDLHIIDLAVDNGILGTVSYNGHLYVRTAMDTQWVRVQPTLIDTATTSGVTVTYPASSGVCTTCAIDKTTNEVIAGFTLKTVASSDPNRSWIYYLKNPYSYRGYQLVDDEGNTGYKIVSIDNNGTKNLASVIANWSGLPYVWNDYNHNGGYFFTNTDELTRSGVYNVKMDSDGSIVQIYKPNLSVHGDGKYIYEVEGRTFYYGPSKGFITDIDATEITTIASGLGSFLDYRTPDFTRAGPEFTIACGNREIVFPEYSNAGLTFVKHNFKTGKTDKRTYTDPYYEILGTSVGFENDRRVYALVYSADPGLIRLIYYSPTDNLVHDLAGNGFPSTLYGGTFSYVTFFQGCEHAYQLDDNTLAFVVNAGYDNVPSGDTTVSINVPAVIFYKVGTGVLEINLTAGDLISAIGGVDALTNIYINTGGALKDAVYIATEYYLPGGDRQALLKICPAPFPGSIIYTGGDGEFAYSALGDKNFLYFAYQDNFATAYYLRTAVSGIVVNQLNCNVNDITLFNQIDERNHYYFSYDATTGDVTGRPLASGLSSYVYNLDIKPDHTPINGSSAFSDWTNMSLVHDMLYLNIRSNIGTSMRKVAGVVYPTSGRLSPVDYTKWAKNDAMLLQGYGNAPYTMTMDTYWPSTIESSVPWMLAAFESTTYSGLVISGIQTGWNQGQLYLTHTGNEGEYSEVVLNGLHSYVTDVRQFTMLSGEASKPYVMLPQPTDTILPISASGITELVLIDTSAMKFDDSTAIISSGTLNQYATVIKTFSGWATHLETTNTQDVPYMFVSISGIPPKFYQKDGHTVTEAETDFIDRTNNFPQASITCIRADDAI